MSTENNKTAESAKAQDKAEVKQPVEHELTKAREAAGVKESPSNSDKDKEAIKTADQSVSEGKGESQSEGAQETSEPEKEAEAGKALESNSFTK